MTTASPTRPSSNPHPPSFSRPKRSCSRAVFPAYLYQRNTLFYFRCTLPASYQKRCGKTEIRLSLHTAYLRVAKQLAQQLRHSLHQLLEADVDYNTLRLRLNGLLRAMLEHDAKDLTEYPPVDIPGIGRISRAEYYSRTSNIHKIQMMSTKGLSTSAQQLIPYLLQLGIIHEQDISTPEDILLITKEFLKMEVNLNRINKCRENGDFLTEQTAFSADYIPVEQWTQKQSDPEPISEPHSDVAPAPGQYTLSEIIDKYIETKLSDGAWESRSVADHKNRLTVLVDVLGNKNLSDVTRADMRLFREKLRQLPPNRNRVKPYAGKNIDEILKMKPTNVLSIKTVNITIEAIASLFEWCVREEILQNNPAKSLQVKDNRQEIELRDAFTIADLNLIFTSQKFIEKDFVNRAYYWVPLIGLFSGMRLEEICQLYVDDLYEIDGVWVFDINEKPDKGGTRDKQVKNKNAVRLVPIHSQLIELGLLDYHQKMKALGTERLFPDLNKTEKSPRYGKQVGKTLPQSSKESILKGKRVFTLSGIRLATSSSRDNFRAIYSDRFMDMKYLNWQQNSMAQNSVRRSAPKKL